MAPLRLVIPGEPVGKERARTFWDPRVERMVSVTPRKTSQHEDRVRQRVGLALRFRRPDPDGRYAVEATFYLSTLRRKDADNLGKCLLDALNGVIWNDDSQVYDEHFRKDDTDPANPRTELLIYQLP